jgi:hypothetical protein
MIKMKILPVALALALAALSLPAGADDVSDPTGYPTLKTAGVTFGTINEKGFYAKPGFSVAAPETGGLLVPLLLIGLCGLMWLGGQKRPDHAD